MKNEQTRRNFIKTAGLASLAVLSLPLMGQNVSAKENENMFPEKSSETKTTILFQGDSITDGNRTRDNDWNHIMGHGYACLIASRLWFDFPQQGLMFINRGISGNRVSDLEKRWQTDTLDLKPDILSILIGINDVMAVVKDWGPTSVKEFKNSYRIILQKTLEKNPKTKIILCEPFTLPLGWTLEKPEVWKSELEQRQQVAKELSTEFKTHYIELQKPFNEACKKAEAKYWIWDGVHPMPAGHELIARLWIKEMRSELNFIKKTSINY